MYSVRPTPKLIQASPLVTIVRGRSYKHPMYDDYRTGPLTSSCLQSSHSKPFCGEDYLYFYDAIAHIVLGIPINHEICLYEITL
jgi:folate-dependent tRNA-U54 methylase TrmFO/GidA